MNIKKLNINNEKWLCFVLAVFLIIFVIISRLLPHPPNFTPIAAVAIFGGVVLPRRLAVVLPLVAMIISDLIIGLHPLIIFTWGCFALIALLSSRYFKKVSFVAVMGAGIGASILFYLVTNFGVWLQGQMYPMTITGLIDCYYRALPFLRNTMLGDMLFVAAFFGLYAFVNKSISLHAIYLGKSKNIIKK